jgi:hypothetical protein
MLRFRGLRLFSLTTQGTASLALLIPYLFFLGGGEGTESGSSSTNEWCYDIIGFYDALTFAVIQTLASNQYFHCTHRAHKRFDECSQLASQQSDWRPLFWCRHNSLMLELPDPFPSPAPKKKKVKGWRRQTKAQPAPLGIATDNLSLPFLSFFIHILCKPHPFK